MGRLTKRIVHIFIGILFFSNLYAKNPPPGTGTSDLPANIMIMLDNSGSMDNPADRTSFLELPLDVNVDSNGNVYVLEYLRDRIAKFDADGNLLTRFGSTGSGCNQWYNAFQFEVYDGHVYVADTQNGRIVKLDLNGNCVATASVMGTLRERPRAISAGAGYIWVAGAGRDLRIASYNKDLSINSGGNVYSNEGGGNNWSWGMSFNNNGSELLYANGGQRELRLAKRSGHQLIAENSPYSSNRVRTCNANFPTDVAWDSAGNAYYLSDRRHQVIKINMTTCAQTVLVGGWGQGSSQFRAPRGIEIDSNDNIYIADFRNLVFKKFDINGNVLIESGGGGTRLAAAKRVIKKIVSNTDLTSGAYFGLMEWGSPRKTRIRVPISANGASRIFTNVDGIRADGGTDLKNALNKMRNQFVNGRVPDWTLECSANYLIVISDGHWMQPGQVNNRARQMAAGLSDGKGNVGKIKTFAVGFTVGSGAQPNYRSLATAGQTNAPMFADNEAQLLSQLTDAIKRAISGRLTFTTPAVMSDVQRNNFVYQSTFEYEKNIQWKGSVKKYKLETNGQFGPEQWDAATKLNNKSSNSRNIWTVGLSTTGLNNFVTSNRSELKGLIFPNTPTATDDDTDNLINFIRGLDTYDQDSDSSTTTIHKLADIYHSNLIVVGPPEASTVASSASNYDKTEVKYRIDNSYNNFKTGSSCGGPCAFRTELLYAGANNGILHAFKTSDGEELWGFIPPMVLGNLERIPSNKANATNPIYGVDGSPVVKDVFIDDTPNDNVNNPRWRTILLSGLGAGGHGIFALDITDANNPKQLFAIENNPIDKQIHHWDNTGNVQSYGYAGGVIQSDLDYRKLGETWSTPRIIRLKINGKQKWVAVFGAGYNGGVNPDVGSAVFVMDIENEGRLIKVIDLDDKANVVQSYNKFLLPNNTQTEFTLANWGLQSYNSQLVKPRLSGHGGINYAVTGDENGDIINNLKLTLDSAPQGILFLDLVEITDIVNSVPADISLITPDGTSKANYFGAMAYVADLEGKITKINLTDQGTLYEKTTLFDSESNSINGRYLYNRPVMTFNDGNLWLYFGTGNTQHLQEQQNGIQNRLYGIKDIDFPNFRQVNPTINVQKCKTFPTCPTSSDKGWYVDLNERKLSAETTIDKDRVYAPIYQPAMGLKKCDQGEAILGAYDTKCGQSIFNINMGKGVLSKVVVQGDNLYIGIAGKPKENIGEGFTSTGNIITGKSQASGGTGTVQTEYWKEID